MDEKQRTHLFGALSFSKHWTYLLAASLLTLVPVTAAASGTDGKSENTAQAVQQTKKTVMGRVTDPAGETVVGATVAETGNPTNAVITDMEGKFSLQVVGGG